MGVFLLMAEVQVVASGSIGAESFGTEVMTYFSSVLLGDVHFLSDFHLTMSKGALNR